MTRAPLDSCDTTNPGTAPASSASSASWAADETSSNSVRLARDKSASSGSPLSLSLFYHILASPHPRHIFLPSPVFSPAVDTLYRSPLNRLTCE